MVPPYCSIALGPRQADRREIVKKITAAQAFPCRAAAETIQKVA